MLGLSSSAKCDGRILIVGARPNVVESIVPTLSAAGFHPSMASATDLRGVTSTFSSFDLAVVVCGGRERADRLLLQRLVRAKVPCIVILAGTGSGHERATWLERGASDCLGCPVHAQELTARLRVHLRYRALRPMDPWQTGDFVFFPAEQRAERSGRRLVLTTCEYALLAALAEHAGHPLRREQLLEIARGSAEVAFDRAIDVQVSRLRAKLDDDSRDPRILKTVRGVGYMLAIPHNDG